MENHSWFTKLGLKYVRGGKITPLNQTSDEVEASHLHYKVNGDIDDTVHHRESKHGGVIYKHPGSPMTKIQVTDSQVEFDDFE